MFLAAEDFTIFHQTAVTHLVADGAKKNEFGYRLWFCDKEILIRR
jgi:hypothetical protein